MADNQIERMKEIGGYFSLERNESQRNKDFHTLGIFLNSGRHALEHILSSIPVISQLWIPYFTCDVVLEPIKRLSIPYCFYHINENLELGEEILLASDEYLLVTNYYGIKDNYIKSLSLKYGQRLIVDNAQALYSFPIEGIKTFFSPRKFVGIPDGGIAYVEGGKDIHQLDVDVSYNRMSHLLKRIDLGASAGYQDFRENSRTLVNQPIRRMSRLTKTLFDSIDFEEIERKRNENFKILHEVLGGCNSLLVPDMDSFACPLIYPYMTEDVSLKGRLITSKVFVATYWPNVFEWCPKDSTEYKLAERVIALPIDQRYGEEDMKRIIEIVKQ